MLTLKLKHPFTLIVAGPTSCGKSTFVIRLLDAGRKFVTLGFKTLCGVIVKNTPRIILKMYHLLNESQTLKNVKMYLRL